MKWLLGNQDQQSDQAAQSTTPNAEELRRRRIAKLEEEQAAEKARRKEFEERKARWAASKRASGDAIASSSAQSGPSELPVQPPAPAPSRPQPRPEPPVEPEPKRVAPSLPSTEVMASRIVSRTLAVAVDSRSTIDGKFLPDLIDQLRSDSSLSESEPLVLDAEAHADDILLFIISSHNSPLEYLFGCYVRCGQQLSDIGSNKRLHAPEQASRRAALQETTSVLSDRIFTYTAMLLSGAFMENEQSTPEKFAEYLLNESIPAGFIRAFINRHIEVDAFEEISPIFRSVFIYIRNRASVDSKICSSSFLKPLNALTTLLSNKELCRLLTADEMFTPMSWTPTSFDIVKLEQQSYLYPFFYLSALPGAPIGRMPLYPEDPAVGAAMFPNPTALDRAEVDAASYSLRSSLSVARNLLSQICLSLCKAGPEPKDMVLIWLSTVLNENKKRVAMRPEPQVISRDGFMVNIMFVLLKLCEPIVSGGWNLLSKIDPLFPQARIRIDYSEETRLAADSNMLDRWWVDQRNENAQESLTRQMEVTARESGVSSAVETTKDEKALEFNFGTRSEVGNNFNFVTECFWMALRSIQLTYVPMVTLYEEEISRMIQRMRDAIKDMEAAKEAGTLPADQVSQLAMIKQRFDMLIQTKFCYDVYLYDTELLNMLVRFVTADAEWIMKKLLIDPQRDSLLPLPLPVDETFAALPEHTVDIITNVLITTMHMKPDVVMDHSSQLEDMVSFCIVGSASPLHIKNPYLRAKLVEFLSLIFPRSMAADLDDEDGKQGPPPDPAMEALFNGHVLSRKFLPGSLFRLYVDVEHTGSHNQFYDKFSIRYRIGSILESLWYMNDYVASVRKEAQDETRFMRFVNMVLNDAIHLLDSVLDELEEMRALETLMKGGTPEWENLTDEEKLEKQDHLQKLERSARSYNQLANNNVKLLWLLTGDDVVKRIFLRDEMVSRLAEMLNYLLERLSGQRCSELKVSDPVKVSWKPRQLLKRIMETYIHFLGEDEFIGAVAKDGRSYKAELFTRAIGISKRRRLLNAPDIRSLEELAAAAARAHEVENAAEEDLGEIPDEFLDPIMSVLMRNPVRLPTSGNVMDRSVISRILLSDKLDPFNRKLLTEDMLEDEVDLKRRIDAFLTEKRGKGSGS